jgi:hypothetical protein
MFDPASIGTTIIWLQADKEREADVERRGLAVPVSESPPRRSLGRRLARQLRSAADRLDPGVSSDPKPA